MAQGAPASAGTRDTRVDRPNEGLPGLATVENPTANPATRGAYDIAGSAGGMVNTVQAQVDTTETAGIPTSQAVKRAKPASWA